MARVRRVLGHGWRHGWRTVAIATTFVTSSVVGLALHGNLPPVRRLAVRITNDVLADFFEGKIVVEDVKSVTIAPRAYVDIGKVTVFDPQGHAIIHAEGITADIRLDRLVGSLLAGRAPDVDIEHARIANADVVLDRNPDGTLPMVRTFEPRPKPKTAAAKNPPPLVANQEDVVLHIAEASVRHAWVHGNIVPPALDGDAHDVRARLAIERDVFTLDLLGGKTTLRSPRVPEQVGDVRADATGHMSVPIETALLTADVDLKGDVGGLPFTAHAEMRDNETVNAKLDVPIAEPALIAKVFPSIRVTHPVEVHARAEGKLPVLGLHLDAKSASSEVKADGEIDLREGHSFKVDADVTRFDATIVGGPTSDLSAHAHAEGHIDKAPNATFKVTAAAGSIAGQNVPAVVAEGRIEEGKVTSTFRANEKGVDASGKIVLDVAKNDAAFDVQARSNDLSKLERAPRVASGAASVRIIGNVDLKTQTIRARATADGDGVASGPFSAGHAHAVAAVSGPVTAPVLDVLANGTNVRLSTPGKAPLVYAKAVGQARVTFVPTPRISKAAVTVGDPGSKDAVVATVDSVDLGAGGVVVRGAKVTGIGAPIEVEIDMSGPRWMVRAKADDIDLERAASLTGISQLRLLPPGSRASVDIDVASDGEGAHGHADLAVRTAKGGASVDAHLAFSGRQVKGHARGELAGLGWMEIPSAELDLDGPPSAASFARATGFADLRGAIDLSQIGIPGDDVEQVNGQAIVEARIERYDRNALPAIRATVATRDLEIMLAGGRETIQGIQAAAHAAWDGRTEDAEVAFMTWDGRGVLASGNAKTRLPLSALAQGKQKPFFDALASASLSGIIDVPMRPLESLPALLAMHGLAGRVGGRAQLSGALMSPQLSIVAKAANVREKGRREDREQRYEPIDAVVEAHWDGQNVVAVLSADERDRPKRAARKPALAERTGDPNRRGGRDPNRGSGRVRAMVVGRITGLDLIAIKDGKDPHFTADAEVEVEDLDLSPIPLKSRMRGDLTGRITLRDLGNAPSITAKAHVNRFAVSGARVDALDVDLGARDGSLFASARAIDGGKSVLDVTVASRALQWKGLLTTWNADELTRVDYRAAGLRLSLLRSFARDTIADLDGQLDGRGSAMFDAKSQTFDGQLALSGGRLYVNALGEDVTDVHAVARFEPNGVFRIQDATGKVDQGEFRASATGRMQGLSFVGANATVVVPQEKNGIPLSSEGVSFAEATGEVGLEARMSDDRKALLVTVDIPRARLELPRRATPNLQPLEADETIKTGIRMPNGRLDAISLDHRVRRATSTEPNEPPPDEIATKFTVVLGNDVYLEGNGLHIQISGKTLVDITDEVKVTGRIDLRGGTITAQGRTFTVDLGAVTFPEGGDAANPTVIASAYWDAPDRTRIWVEFKGPLKTGRLTLRSEPAFSKNEIFSILLFGRPDPNMAVNGSKVDQGSQGVAVGAGFAAADLTRALAELDENLQVETDTLSGNRTRAKVGYRLARNLRVQVGAASATTLRDKDRFFAFLDWQFLPKLSLVATRGDTGTSILDVIFQHRY
jgi:hypothetical protein